MSLLRNGDFSEVNPQGPVSAFTREGSNGAGQSGAAHWTTWVMSMGGTIKTTHASSAFPGSRGRMLTVSTSGGGGIVQAFASYGKGYDVVTACVWLMVEQGEVGVGIGDGGNTGIGMVLRLRDKWERITVSNGVRPANQIIVYAQQSSARFHVAFAEVNEGAPWEQQALCVPS